ncbi:MAG: MarR family winged helix-turn-helix transcriptional regulator [Geminicoccaceae bacterium]|nr:MarR family winged helix-turn-helix transcriptional regulator [Geminicoccaceae bacterium]MDW8341971.1 MarR family winged helix-turn-helix transcriptional regulator [Geminicoccaceae bacterium]
MKPMSTVSVRDRPSPTSAPEASPFRLEDFLPYRLSVTANRVSRAFARLYAERFGLTIPEWRVMAVLGTGGPMPASAIVERTAMDKVKVSRAVAALEAKGYLARRPHPEDRRSALLELGPRGRAVFEQIVPLARALEAELTAALGPQDRALLVELLARLDARLARLGALPQEVGDPG